VIDRADSIQKKEKANSGAETGQNGEEMESLAIGSKCQVCLCGDIKKKGGRCKINCFVAALGRAVSPHKRDCGLEAPQHHKGRTDPPMNKTVTWGRTKRK